MCLLLVLITIVGSGCSVKSTEISLEDDETNVFFRELDSISIDGRYVLFENITNANDDMYVLDTKELIVEKENESTFLNENYVEYSQSGVLSLVDKKSSEINYQSNLIESECIKQTGDVQYIRLSKSERYLWFYQLNPFDKIIIDTKEDRIIEPPVKGKLLTIDWSSNDDKAIILSSDSGVRELNIWSLEDDNLQKLIIGKEVNYYWSPECNFVYYVMSETRDNSIDQGVYRYSLESENADKVYHSEKWIYEDTIKWLNSDEFIFFGKRQIKRCIKKANPII